MAASCRNCQRVRITSKCCRDVAQLSCTSWAERQHVGRDTSQVLRSVVCTIVSVVFGFGSGLVYLCCSGTLCISLIMSE